MPLEIEEEEEDVGKADGLKKFCEFLPFTNTLLEEFMSNLQEILTDEEYEGLTLDSIKDKFQSFTEWQLAFDSKTDIKLDQFLESCLFINDNKQTPRILDQERLSLFAYFSC